VTTRRNFLHALGALGAAQALPGHAFGVAGAARFDSDPFTLGVASGYPSPHGVVLWTRLAPDPSRGDGGLDPVAIPVRWQISLDEGMRRVVADGVVEAGPAWAHSVRVEVDGLEPGCWYWYRFAAGDAFSPIGRTRTAPPPNASATPLRFAFASCQHYEQGWFSAYRPIVADEPDLIAFLGDYIYESSWGREHVRSHNAGEPYSLDDYRVRHALYKGDAELRAAHAACPWIVTWDDHEVDNDYADDRAEDGLDRALFLARRAAAYQAYYEHMPLPARMRPDGPHMRLYTQLGWGGLARFFLLDNRQYRSHHPCPRPYRGAGSNVVDVAQCGALADPQRTLLGEVQERWLETALVESRAAWNLLAQQTLMAQLDQLPGPGRRAWTDGWDGYPAARRRLIEFLAARRIANPVVLGGDVHMHYVAQLKADFDDPASPVVASEFTGTSITSQGPAMQRIEQLLPDNPHILYAESRYRGYVRVELSRERLRADLRGMQSVKTKDAPCDTLASFVVENGRPGPRRM
jgi:alkaline phosphatase D